MLEICTALHLNSSVSIGQLVQTVRQFGFFHLDKWVIKCSAVELFEAMDCIFEVCYDLKEEDTQYTIACKALFHLVFS